jgi:hypothetical protein
VELSVRGSSRRRNVKDSWMGLDGVGRSAKEQKCKFAKSRDFLQDWILWKFWEILEFEGIFGSLKF